MQMLCERRAYLTDGLPSAHQKPLLHGLFACRLHKGFCMGPRARTRTSRKLASSARSRRTLRNTRRPLLGSYWLQPWYMPRSPKLVTPIFICGGNKLPRRPDLCRGTGEECGLALAAVSGQFPKHRRHLRSLSHSFHGSPSVGERADPSKLRGAAFCPAGVGLRI